jgi:hypothetical protein
MLLNHHAGMDEFVTSMYAENIRVAQEGLFRLKLVFGTITFGYRGKEIAGMPTRQKRPRREYEIDPEAAECVRRIFHRFVHDRLSIAEIVRCLNEDLSVPLGPKAVSGRWTRLAVKLLLANPRYRGHWAYGTTQSVWQAKQDYTRQVEREQPLACQQFEELRIIDDKTWYAAARRLATEQERNAGRKAKDGDRQSRPRLLNGLFVCAAHGRRLYVGGTHGKVMFCPECQGMPAEQRPLFTLLNRVVALRRTCERLADVVRADPALIQDVVAAFRREVEAAQQPDPAAPLAATARIEKLSQRIRFIMANPGDTEKDREESAALLRKLRAERADAESAKAALEATRDQPKVVPTVEEVTGVLNSMHTMLIQAASEGPIENAGAAREIIELLTSGRIEVEQQGERKAQRGWLRGRCRTQLLDVVISQIAGVQPLEVGPAVEVTIEYRKPEAAERWADQVKQLYDRGLLLKMIARELGIGRNLTRKALEEWHRQRGLPKPPDGRSRRSHLQSKG